jgi:hypothetical protein
MGNTRIAGTRTRFAVVEDLQKGWNKKRISF